MRPLSLSNVRSAIIVAPHPDDEAIGAYGLIRALKARSARVRIVVATDGAGSHPNSVRWPRRRLIAERQRETRAVMRGIGVPAGDIAFLALPDGRLSDIKGAIGAIQRAVARVRGCDLLVVPAADDDHPDHRIVAAALRRSRTRRLRYLVWPGRQAPSRRASHMLRLGHVAFAKRHAIRRYRSQMGAIVDDPTGFAITRRELVAFAQPVERFREGGR